jgi:hypothetical protein
MLKQLGYQELGYQADLICNGSKPLERMEQQINSYILRTNKLKAMQRI